jgi:hypothetical protein
MRALAACFGLCLATAVQAAEPNADLPPADAVARVLRAAPSVRAAGSMVRVEEANRARLEAGPHEWTVRLVGQRRRVDAPDVPAGHFYEQGAALERPIRMPGKAALDAELGAKGVEIAEWAHGDALHEAGRALLRDWFAWLREGETARQWAEQTVLLGRHAQGVARRQQLGDAARVDTIQAEAAFAQAEAQLTQARVRERKAAEELRRRYPGLLLPESVKLSEPEPVRGDEAEWTAAILEHSHELGVARGEAQRAQVAASRNSRDILPDPTLGVHAMRERGGEEHILGVSIAIPLPGQARRATADAARAEADAASSREAAALQKISTEAATLYHAASAARASWESSRLAAERLTQAADMTARAYQLGEGSLNDLLTARRLANEAQLGARVAQLDALELRYRLLLDAHRMWDLEEH